MPMIIDSFEVLSCDGMLDGKGRARVYELARLSIVTALAITELATARRCKAEVAASPPSRPQDHILGGNFELTNNGTRSVEWPDAVDTIPNWYLPLWSLKECDKLDGFACGVGIRICKAFFIAPVNAMTKVSISLDRYGKTNAPPGVFQFELSDQADISKRYDKGWEYQPEFVKDLGDNIGLYWAKRRDDNKVHVFDKYPLEKLPVLGPEKWEFEPADCKMITLGSGSGAPDGVKKPLRKWVAMPVKMFCYNSGLCIGMVGLRPPPDRTPYRICSEFSDLGAPIICGDIENAPVRYIVKAIDGWPSTCRESFVAVDIGRKVDQLRALLKKNLNYETGLVQDGRPIAQGLVKPNRFPKACWIRGYT